VHAASLQTGGARGVGWGGWGRFCNALLSNNAHARAGRWSWLRVADLETLRVSEGRRSIWLTTDTASRIFTLAERRVYRFRNGVSLKRLLDESPWLQFTSKCQRFGPPPRLNK
jgi:hypothetical protein